MDASSSLAHADERDSTMKLRNRSFLTTVAAAALSLTLVVPALAQDATTATVTGGSLTMTTPTAGDFSTSITGVAQTLTTPLATFSVSDLTGTGAGWKVTAGAAQFSTGGVTPRTLATGSLKMTAPTVTANGTTSAAPTITAGPYTIDSGTAVKIGSAAVDTGMGTYDFTATTLSLSLPANVYAGSYASTVTLTAASAP